MLDLNKIITRLTEVLANSNKNAISFQFVLLDLRFYVVFVLDNNQILLTIPEITQTWIMRRWG